jgi:uncharacterized protein (TIGR03435 family)
MRTGNTALLISLLGVLIAAAPRLSLSQSAQEKPKFEVASIKPNLTPTGGTSIRGEPSGTRITMTRVPVKMVMSFAYRVRDFQIVGGPDWINVDRYDIEAKLEDIGKPRPILPPDPNVPDEMALCIQSLLEDRFQLKAHKESRDLPVYELTATKGGSKMTLAADQSMPQLPKPGDPPPPRPEPGARPGRGGLFIQRTPAGFTLKATGVSLAQFISNISQLVGRPVVNKTELNSGLYDIDLEWADNGPSGGPPLAPGTESAPSDTSGPSIFTALQEQLGLRLVSAKGPVDVVVIDSVQKPTAN